MSDIEISKTTEYLKHVFTEQEKRELADQMAEASVKVREIEGNLKSVSTQLKAEVNKHQAILDQAGEKYRAGFEYRETKCEITKDFNLGYFTLIRLDTGEVVKERPLEGEERQKSIPFKKEE